METTPRSAEPAENQDKGKKVIVMIVIFVLVLVNGLLLWQFFDKGKKIQEQDRTITAKADSLREMRTEYESLSSEFRSVQEKNSALQSQLTQKDEEIQAQLQKIKTLLRDQANLNRLRSELEKLKDMNTQYVTQVEDLKKKNEELTSQNKNLSTNLNDAKSQNENLSHENEKLATKVAKGSVLRTEALNAIGVKFKSSGKEVDVKKAKDVQKVKVCFTILENVVTDKGEKDIYIRLLGPDNAVLSTSSESFDYNGKPTLFSVKEPINYDNKKDRKSVV